MNYKRILLILSGLLIMVLILWYIGIDTIINAIKEANPYLILLALGLQIISFLLLTGRWHLVNRATGVDVNFFSLLPMTIVGMAVNNITPSARGGGEPVRAYILTKKYDIPFERTLASVVADRSLDMFPFILLAIVTIISMILTFNISLSISIILSICVVGVVAAFILVIIVCINKDWGERIVNWALRQIRRFYKKKEGILEERVLGAVEGFQTSMKDLLTNKKVMLIGMPLSLLIWIFEILRVYVIFLAFGSSVSIFVIGAVFIISSLVGMIPLLPGGLGVIEGLMITLYSLEGVTRSISAAVTVVERLISYWFVVILGLAILPYYGTSIIDDALHKNEDLEK